MAITILNGFIPLESSQTGKEKTNKKKSLKRLSLVRTERYISPNSHQPKFIQRSLALLSPGLPAIWGPLLLTSVTSPLLVHTLTSLATRLVPMKQRGTASGFAFWLNVGVPQSPVWGPSPLTAVSLGHLIPSTAYRDSRGWFYLWLHLL